jgi:hypothetical protein
MDKEKPSTCQQGYGTRSQGICPFDIEGGTCRSCPESVAAFGVVENVPGKDGGYGNSASPVPLKEKGARLLFANRLKKRAQLLIGWINNRRHKNSPCFDCIKRGGICQPERERRRKA